MKLNEISEQKNGSVQTISWRRLEKKNAFTASLASELGSVIERIGRDESVSAIFLDPGIGIFSSGWDLAEIAKARKEGISECNSLVDSGRACLDKIANSPCLTIAICRGSTFGFGISMICNSDVVLVQSSAKFILPELDAGIVPASVLGDLVSKVGLSRALRWSILGHIELSEAIESGLVTDIYSEQEIDLVKARIVDRLNSMRISQVRRTINLARLMRNLSLNEVKSAGDNAAKQILSSESWIDQ